MQFKSITIIQTAFLGDSALIFPLIESIKLLNADCKINVVSTPAARDLFLLSPYIDNVIAYDKSSDRSISGIKKIAQNLMELETECIISPHRSLRSSLLTYFAKPKYSVGFNTNQFSILYKKSIVYHNAMHEKDRNLFLLSAFKEFDIDMLERDLKSDLNFDNVNVAFVDDLLEKESISITDKIAILAPGSVWETKRWGARKFTELARLLISKRMKVILIGGKSDISICSQIADDSESLNFAGLTSIPQTIYLMSKSVVTITNDSAPTHFAGLIDCPVVTIFGATSPIFGFGPSSFSSLSIQDNDLGCRPCRIHGSRKCPLGTMECMENISAVHVFNSMIERDLI